MKTEGNSRPRLSRGHPQGFPAAVVRQRPHAPEEALVLGRRGQLVGQALLHLLHRHGGLQPHLRNSHLSVSGPCST